MKQLATLPLVLSMLVSQAAVAQTPSVDSVFATNGQMATPFPFTAIEVTTERMLPIHDGHYLGIGSAIVPSFEIQGVLAKFDVCGVPDATFGDNGFVYIPGGAGWQMKLEGGVELADGSLLVHGTTAQGFGAYSSNRPTLVKLSPDGQLDPSYGTDGILRRDFPGGVSCGFGTGFIPLPDGKLLSVACRDGNVNGGSPGLSLYRYAADGQPDPSFASSGGLHINKSVAAGRAEGHVIGDTTILVAYGGRTGDFGQFVRIELNAFDTAGNPVSTFGTGGVLEDTTLFGGSGRWTFSSVLDEQDRLVVFGTTYAPDNNNMFQVIRFLPDGTRDIGFGTNGRTLVPQLPVFAGGAALATRLVHMTDGTWLCVGHVLGQGGIADTQLFRLTADGQSIAGSNGLLQPELHAYQVSDVVEVTDGRLLAQARSQSPAPIAQMQMRLADPAVTMPHISPAGASLEVTGTGPDFHWYRDGAPVPGATGTVFTPTQNGTYTVEMTDVFGCTVFSAPLELLTVGVPMIGDASAIPLLALDANGMLAVHTDATFRYDLIDMRGARLDAGVVRQGTSTIRVDGLSAGTYLLVLRSEQDRRILRFAKP